MLQIQAKDTLITEYTQDLHTSYTQLHMEILDVNDETPELRMVSKKFLHFFSFLICLMLNLLNGIILATLYY